MSMSRGTATSRYGRAVWLETLVVVPAIAAFVAGNVFFQGLFPVFSLTCRQRAGACVVPGFLPACILVATIVVLIPRPAAVTTSQSAPSTPFST